MTTDVKTSLLGAEVNLLEAQARDVEAKLAKYTERDVHHLPFVGGVGTDFVRKVVGVLSTCQTEDRLRGKKKPIILTVNLPSPDHTQISPYIDAFALSDYLRLMIKDGYDISIEVSGYAVQQAAVLLQTEGVKRYMSPSSHIMFTEDNPQVYANSAEIDKIELHQGFEQHAWRIVAERTGGKIDAERLAKETAYRREWWIDSTEAVKLGLVDDVKVLLTSETSYQPQPQLLPAPNDSLAVRRKKAKLRRDIAQAQLLKYSTLGSQLETTASDVPFISGVGPVACANASNLLQSYARNSSEPLHMLVYSPGGSVVDGASLLDVIREIKKTHTLTTTTLGCAASMAGHLSQAASEGQRRMGKNGRMMIHRIARVFSGGQSQNKDQKAMMEKLEESVLPILIGRSDISREEYMERTAKSDWWLTAPEALGRKLVDEVF